MNFSDRTDGSDSNLIAESVASQHAECSEQLLRLAWAIVRDWELAADAVQETFALFAEKLPTIEADHQRGWLVKTVQFQALNLRRSQQSSTKLLDRLREQPTTYTTQNSLPTFERQDELNQLREAIRDLPPDQRQVIQLRLANELSFAEIAEQLQLPLGTVLSRMRLALEKLRRKLPSDEH